MAASRRRRRPGSPRRLGDVAATPARRFSEFVRDGAGRSGRLPPHSRWTDPPGLSERATGAGVRRDGRAALGRRRRAGRDRTREALERARSRARFVALVRLPHLDRRPRRARRCTARGLPAAQRGRRGGQGALPLRTGRAVRRAPVRGRPPRLPSVRRPCRGRRRPAGRERAGHQRGDPRRHPVLGLRSAATTRPSGSRCRTGARRFRSCAMARPPRVSGRGLRLVAAVARDWGVELGPDGKTVWAELPLR